MKQIFNFKFSILKKQDGFTLIEILTVVVVFLIVGTIIGATLFTALRSRNKAEVITTVRQNGNFAITQMSKMVRLAKKFKGVSTNGASYSTDCTQQTSDPTPMAIAYHYLKFDSFDDGETVFTCDASHVPPIASNAAALVNTNDVVVTACTIYCSQQTLSDYPTIDISFSLNTPAPTGVVFTDRTTSASFQTSVVIRNIER